MSTILVSLGVCILLAAAAFILRRDKKQGKSSWAETAPPAALAIAAKRRQRKNRRADLEGCLTHFASISGITPIKPHGFISRCLVGVSPDGRRG